MATPFQFDANGFSPAISALLIPECISPLGPGSTTQQARNALQRFDPATDLGKPVIDGNAARACHAGLWLYHDGLGQSHEISQNLSTAEGSFYHAIMHRREPDAFNSKYWWRIVGKHPVLDQLIQHAPAQGYPYTTPAAFVDFCQRVRGTGSKDEQLAMRIQLLEWQLLFAWCYRLAVGE